MWMVTFEPGYDMLDPSPEEVATANLELSTQAGVTNERSYDNDVKKHAGISKGSIDASFERIAFAGGGTRLKQSAIWSCKPEPLVQHVVAQWQAQQHHLDGR